VQATTAAIPDDTKVKKDSERIKYTKEFLMQFMEVGGWWRGVLQYDAGCP
jgi:hypothetical protein